MSVHDLALAYVASKVGGKVTHSQYDLRKGSAFGGKIPDIVVDENDVHEVEVVKILKKVKGYKAVKGRKTLWIVFDVNPFVTFDIVKTLCFDHDSGRIKPIEIDGLEKQIDAIYRKKLEKLEEAVSKVESVNKGLERKMLLLLNEKRSLESEIETLRGELARLKERRVELMREIEMTKNLLNLYVEFREGNSLVSVKLPAEKALQLLSAI